MGHGNVQLYEILAQSFKTYLEMLKAFMNPMKIRSFFLYLTQFIMPCPVDHPTFRAFSMLALQGDGRGGYPIGYYLCHLRFIADAVTFQEIAANIPAYLVREALQGMPQ